MTQFEEVLETILEEYARRDSEGEFDTWEETDAFVKEKAEVLLAYIKEEPVSEDLDEKIDEEWEKSSIPSDYWLEFEKVAYNIADWQRQKDKEALDENALLYNARQEGVDIGKTEMKQQMMAKAVDGDITFDYYGDDDKTYGCIAHDSFCLEDFGLVDRDKVKMILIKED